MTFSQKLIPWYLQHKRELPWRTTRDPYKIWLSEVILQQTRVAQGLPYYESFVKNFPTIFDLAKADEQQVLKIWQGLGYYSRARNLHHTAQYVSEQLNGEFPKTYNELIKLKGIGSYTAAAIASFSNQEAVAVVDGNVFRVLSRYFGIETDISSSQAKKEFQQLANEVLDPNQPALFNQSIMEFGALQCTPKNPNCEICIFNTSCFALQKNKVEQLPVKLKKTKVRQRFLNYLVLVDENQNTIINKRTQNGIWKNLYEFPLLEVDTKTDLEVISQKITDLYTDKYPLHNISIFNTKEIIHKLSHQELHILFWRIEVKNRIKNGVLLSDISEYPFPIVIYNFITNVLNVS